VGAPAKAKPLVGNKTEMGLVHHQARKTMSAEGSGGKNVHAGERLSGENASSLKEEKGRKGSCSARPSMKKH